jgi:hypothetical protein
MAQVKENTDCPISSQPSASVRIDNSSKKLGHFVFDKSVPIMDIVTADSFVEIFATISEFRIWWVEGEQSLPKANPEKGKKIYFPF